MFKHINKLRNILKNSDIEHCYLFNKEVECVAENHSFMLNTELTDFRFFDRRARTDNTDLIHSH
jgi:hypothetical protein